MVRRGGVGLFRSYSRLSIASAATNKQDEFLPAAFSDVVTVVAIGSLLYWAYRRSRALEQPPTPPTRTARMTGRDGRPPRSGLRVVPAESHRAPGTGAFCRIHFECGSAVTRLGPGDFEPRPPGRACCLGQSGSRRCSESVAGSHTQTVFRDIWQ